MVFSPDGTILATAGEDGFVRLWNLADLSARRSLPVVGGPVYGLAFSADGTWIVTGNGAGDLRVWDLSSGELRDAFRGRQHIADIQSVAFLSGDRTIVSAGGYGILQALGCGQRTVPRFVAGSHGQDLGRFGLTGRDDHRHGQQRRDRQALGPATNSLMRTLTLLTARDGGTPMAVAYTPDERTLIVAQGVGARDFFPRDDTHGYIVNATLEVRGFDLITGRESFHRILERGKSTYGANLNHRGGYAYFFPRTVTVTTWEVGTGMRLATISRVAAVGWASDSPCSCSGQANRSSW